MTEDIVKKIIASEKRMSEEKGNFSFFGIFKRKDLENGWDIIFSAPWFLNDKKNNFIYIIDNIKKNLTNDDLRMISGIIPVSSDDVVVRKINEIAGEREHSKEEFKNFMVDDIKLKHFYIITSKK